MLVAGLLFTVLATRNLSNTLVWFAAAAALSTIIRRGFRRLSAAGVVQTALAPLTVACVGPWTCLLLQEQGFPAWVVALAGAAGGVGLLTLAFRVATKLADDAVFTHAAWRRPTRPLPAKAGPDAPKVSIHVPCYAEPPEVVIKTLEHLAALNYPNYEVLVCDNNTPDESLWRPVEQHCKALNARLAGRTGARFRFYHVAPLKGAKAGALNFLLPRTARDAELVAVVDADYLAEPDFLSRLTGFFADRKIGFVQSPHDYLPDGGLYQDMCYWEYMPPNKVGLSSINEYDCAYTIGTMCILRKDAIEAAGGWAEWCLTEDSEISIRIRALGYEGVYVNETFGRGLIPETYEDLKKQRFRWTAGPVQQLLAHWRLFMPKALGGRSDLHAWVKLLEVHRSIIPVTTAAAFAAAVLTAAVSFHLTVTGVLPQINFPPVLWLAASLQTIAGLARLFLRYRLTGCSDLRRIAGAELARLSLTLVKINAAVAVLSGRPLKWRRTPKFAANSSLARALYSTAPELALSVGFALLTWFPLSHWEKLGDHASSVAVAACIGWSLLFLTAPVMAILSEGRLKRLSAAEAPVLQAEGVEAAVTPKPLSQAA